MLNNIAVLTSGGDAPGMNACVRAVVRMGISRGLRVFGVHRGYAGLIEGDIEPLTNRSVGGIMQRGGTFLQTARSLAFMQPEGRQQALGQLRVHGIEGLVVIGGNGSMAGALCLRDLGVAVVGVPASIDNDMYGTDVAIGVDTALNTQIETIDKIKDTASSHNRCFVVQVMGRRCGYLALVGGIISGAEISVIPERHVAKEDIARVLHKAHDLGKPHAIAVVAEGAEYSAAELAEYLTQADPGFEVRYTVLGHVQRGGAPSAADRLLATRLGVEAVNALAEGKTGVMVGVVRGAIHHADLAQVADRTRPVDLGEYGLADILAR
jgi:6-phosphofructokinase 1